MKILKNLLLVLFVVVIFSLASARTPFVQRNFAIRYLKKHFDEVYLEKISVGTNSAKIQKLSLSAENLDFKVEDCTIKWSLTDLVFLREIKIKDIVANNAFISYHNAKNKDTERKHFVLPSSKTIAYENLKNKLQNALKSARFINNPKLPIKITIDHLKVNGMADVCEYIIADVVIEGKGFAPMSTAVFDMDATFSVDSQKPLTIKFDGQAKLTQSKDRVLNGIDINSMCQFYDNIETPSQTFNINVSSSIDDSHNTYKLILKEEGSDNTDLDANIVLDKKNEKLSVYYKQNFDLSDFTCLFKQQNPPRMEFSANLNGEFDFNTWNGLLRGSASSTLSHKLLKSVLPSLKTDLSASCDTTLQMTNGILSIKSLDSVCNNSDDSLKVLCYSTNPIAIWEKSQGFLVEKSIFNSGKTLFALIIENFNPNFLIENKSPSSLNAKMSGQIFISSKNGTFFIKTSGTSPLLLNDTSLIINSKKYLEDTRIASSIDLTFGETTKISLDGITVNHASGEEVLTGSIGLTNSSADKVASFDCYAVCQLDQLAKLPLFSKNVIIKSGICSCHILSNMSNASAKGEIDLKIKAFALDKNTMPINAESKITYSYDNEDFKIYIPLDILGEQNTSAYVSLETIEDPNSEKINAVLEVKGESISIPEIQSLANFATGIIGQKSSTLFPQPKLIANSNENGYTYSDQTKKRSSAAWSKINGKTIFGLKKVFLSNSLTLDDFECFCSITDDKIDLKTINFDVANSPFHAFGKLEYSKEQTKNPYSFHFDSTFEMKNLGKLCKIIAPKNNPAVEGSGLFSARLKAEGNTVFETLSSTKGTINADCGNGFLRLSNLLGQKNRFIVNSIWSATALFSEKNAKSANINNLFAALDKVYYNSINISIKRDKDLNVLLENFDILGPELHFNATGKVTYSKYSSISNLPIYADIRVDAARDLGYALDSLGLITDKPRKAKYMQGPRFILKGTVGRPDYSDFSKILYSIF